MINWLKKLSKKEQQKYVGDIGNGDGQLIFWKQICNGFGFPSLEIKVVKYNDWENGENYTKYNISIEHEENSGTGYTIVGNNWKKDLKKKLLKDLNNSYLHTKKQMEKML